MTPCRWQNEGRFFPETAGVPLPPAMVGTCEREGGWMVEGQRKGCVAVDQILLIVGNYTL